MDSNCFNTINDLLIHVFSVPLQLCVSALKKNIHIIKNFYPYLTRMQKDTPYTKNPLSVFSCFLGVLCGKKNL